MNCDKLLSNDKLFAILSDSNAKTMYLRGPRDEIRKMSKKIKEILNEEMKLLNDPSYLKKVKGVIAYLEHYLNSENIPFPKYWKNHGKATKDAQILKTPLGPNDNLFKVTFWEILFWKHFVSWFSFPIFTEVKTT